MPTKFAKFCKRQVISRENWSFTGQNVLREKLQPFDKYLIDLLSFELLPVTNRRLIFIREYGFEYGFTQYCDTIFEKKKYDSG